MAAGLQEFLRRLGQHDEECLRQVLTPVAEASVAGAVGAPQLDSRTRGLVRLAALLALGAPTTSLRWGVELATGSGVNDEDIVAALLSAASAEGTAQLVEGAAPLAVALGYAEPAPPYLVSSPADLPRERA